MTLMCGARPTLPQYIFMAWCLVKHRDNFTFTFTVSRNPQGPFLGNVMQKEKHCFTTRNVARLF
jgi:hypothetical protein